VAGHPYTKSKTDSPYILATYRPGIRPESAPARFEDDHNAKMSYGLIFDRVLPAGGVYPKAILISSFSANRQGEDFNTSFWDHCILPVSGSDSRPSSNHSSEL